jgi:hypothetical protein
MQCHQRIRCQKPILTAKPTVGLPTFFFVWRTCWRSLWLTACTVGQLPNRSHVAKSCILITNRTEYSPCGEASTSSAGQKIPPFYETPKLITVFTQARHLFLSCAILIQFTPSHHIFLPSKQRRLRWPSTGRKKVNKSPYNRLWIEVYLYSFFSLIAKWCGWSTPRRGLLIRGK